MANGDFWLLKEKEWDSDGRQATKSLIHFHDHEILELSIEEYEQLIKKTNIKPEEFWEKFDIAYRKRYGGD